MIKAKVSPSVSEAAAQITASLQEKGFTIFADIDHQANATSADLEMPASRVLIFGNPNIGSPIFVENSAAGLDLPIRVVVFENADGQTMVAYHDPASLAESFGLSPNMKSFQMMAGALAKLTDSAIAE